MHYYTLHVICHSPFSSSGAAVMHKEITRLTYYGQNMYYFFNVKQIKKFINFDHNIGVSNFLMHDSSSWAKHTNVLAVNLLDNSKTTHRLKRYTILTLPVKPE
jgi:hypothetical protein